MQKLRGHLILGVAARTAHFLTPKAGSSKNTITIKTRILLMNLDSAGPGPLFSAAAFPRLAELDVRAPPTEGNDCRSDSNCWARLLLLHIIPRLLSLWIMASRPRRRHPLPRAGS